MSEDKNPVYEEGYNAGFVQGMKMQAQRQADDNAMYISGWNSALEMAVTKLQMFNRSFGADTISSFSVWLRGIKR